MSLVNRMLKDLSAREPTSSGVMQGIRVDSTPRTARRRGFAWIFLLMLAAGGWWWYSQQMPARLPATPAVEVAEPPATPAVEVAEPSATPPPVGSKLRPRIMLAESLANAPAPPPTKLAPARSSTPAPARSSPTPPAPAARTTPTAPPAPEGSTTRTPSPAPSADVPGPRSAAELFAEGQRALERGDAAGAEQHWIDALAADRTFHSAREELGNLRVRQERWADAERSVRRGFEVDPDWIGYRRLAGRLELARHRPAQALELLGRRPPTVADDPEYNGLLASAYQRLDRHHEAGHLYRELANHQPGQGHWWAGYAISREALADSVEAMRAYAQALQDRQLDPRVRRYAQSRLDLLKSKGG